MKLDLNEKLVDFRGKQIIREDLELDVRETCYLSLTAIFNNKVIKPKDKYARGKLANRIINCKSDTICLDVDEIKDLKDLVGEIWDNTVVTLMWDILDPPEEENEKGTEES